MSFCERVSYFWFINDYFLIILLNIFSYCFFNFIFLIVLLNVVQHFGLLCLNVPYK